MRKRRARWIVRVGGGLSLVFILLWVASFFTSITCQWHCCDLIITGGAIDFVWGGLTYAESQADIHVISPRKIQAVTWLPGVYRIDGTELLIPLWLPFIAVLLPLAVVYWLDRSRAVPGRCPDCGYDLTGNASGLCPECGSLVANRSADAAGAVPPTKQNEQR